MKILSQGAEATIFLDGAKVIKERTAKSYRIPQLDVALRKFRTKREAKIYQSLQKMNFTTPKLLSFSEKNKKIELEFIAGEKISDILNEKNAAKICFEIGEKIGLMHNNGIIHGDLTTSNMILRDQVYFIDFGLSFFSQKPEDKAVDLHLLRQALESKHHLIWKKSFTEALKGYSETEPNANEILKRLEKVEERGRNKAKE